MGKGWSSVPIPDGWVQIIRGPRPKSEKWPSSKPVSSTPPTVQGGPSRGRWRNSPSVDTKVRSIQAALASLDAEETSARAELQAAPQRAKAVAQPSARFSRSPDITMAETRLKASKLEQALDALEGTNGTEVEKALVKAKAAAHEKPLTEMIADCKGFIDRAEKRLEKLEAERASEAALLEEGRARLARLEAQAAVAVPMPPATAPASELEAEVSRLREELASVRGVSSTNTGHQPPKKRLREDFVPNTVEEAALWMRCRQQEMEETISMGREADV